MNKDSYISHLIVSTLDMDIEWPNLGPYHQDTIAFWRQVDRVLEHPTHYNRLKRTVVDNAEFSGIIKYVYRASTRVIHNGEACAYATSPTDGSDI